jgi:hypothetical protein
LLKRAFGPEFPGLKELGRNVSLIFVNTSPFFSLARPISSKIIDIGGIVEKLEEEKQLLDEVSNENKYFHSTIFNVFIFREAS